jgi:hypothetical protein
MVRNNDFLDLFFNRKIDGTGPRCVDRRHGSGPRWTRGGTDKTHGDTSPVQGTWALRVAGARRRLLFVVLKPKRLIYKRTDDNCSNF